MKILRNLLAGLILVMLFASALPTHGLAAGGPNEDCPAGTVLVAKFEWDDNLLSYVFEKPLGNEGIVTVTGDASSGSWTSIVGITHVIIKGGQGTYTYMYTWPSGSMGPETFSNSDVPDERAISNIQFCTPPTMVTLVSFTARAKSGQVTLNWETGTEVDNAGFHIYRSTAGDAPQAKANGLLISADGNGVTGASYTYKDSPGFGTFYYWLEDVEFSGKTTLHGPIKVTVRPAFRTPPYRPAIPMVEYR